MRTGPAACYDETGPVTGVQPLSLAWSAWDLELSPDGRSVYIAASESLAHLRRNPATGVLTPAACYGTGTSCTSIDPVAGVFAVEVSKDGQNVYTRGNGTFGAFQRDPLDGTLIPEPDGEDCFAEGGGGGCSDSYGLRQHSFEMEFSPDGQFLYYPIQEPGGIGFFRRNPNGTMTQIPGSQGGCITIDGSSSAPGECATVLDGSGPAMGTSWAARVSPSGAHVLLSGAEGTTVFSRDPDNGKLTKTDCVTMLTVTGCDRRKGSAGMGAAISPDGTRAAIGGLDVQGVGIYTFDKATGTLTQLLEPLGCFSSWPASGCSLFPGGSLYGKVVWAPDGLNFYAASGSLVNVALDLPDPPDFPPVCQSRNVTVPAGTPTVVDLSCTDPDGDPVTLEIARAPTAGVLAGIDQAASTVRYDPFAGYSGPDSFAYRGVARGLPSAEATVTLGVQAPPAPAPPVLPPSAPAPSAPAILSSVVKARWEPSKTHTTVTRLQVTAVPADGQVRLGCKGRGCPFKAKAIPIGRVGDLNLHGYFKGLRKVKGKWHPFLVKLGVGTAVEIRVTAPGQIGKQFAFTMRRGKQPTLNTLCVPPGGGTSAC